jgi:hypothetical protein
MKITKQTGKKKKRAGLWRSGISFHKSVAIAMADLLSTCDLEAEVIPLRNAAGRLSLRVILHNLSTDEVMALSEFARD